MTKNKRDDKGRWTKGTSGNRFGRPTKQELIPPPIHARQVRRDFFDAAHQPITVTVDGQPREVTRIRALFELEFADAINGNSQARKRMLQYHIKFSREHEKAGAKLMRIMLDNERVKMQQEGREGSPYDSLMERLDLAEIRREDFLRSIETMEFRRLSEEDAGVTEEKDVLKEPPFDPDDGTADSD